MVPTGVLTGQIMMVFTIVLLGIWSATQWTAAALGYQMRLGAPWFDLLGMPVYHPWRLFEWWYFFDAYAPDIFLRGGAIAACSGFAGAMVGHRHVGVARTAVQAGHDLWFGTLGTAR
jgi:type IV secretion system protein VirD4